MLLASLLRLYRSATGRWETKREDDVHHVFHYQEHSGTGERRITVPGYRMRALRPWMEADGSWLEK